MCQASALLSPKYRAYFAALFVLLRLVWILGADINRRVESGERLNANRGLVLMQKRIVVTGGTSGIGKATVAMLVAQGHEVIATGLFDHEIESCEAVSYTHLTLPTIRPV